MTDKEKAKAVVQAMTGRRSFAHKDKNISRKNNWLYITVSEHKQTGILTTPDGYSRPIDYGLTRAIEIVGDGVWIDITGREEEYEREFADWYRARGYSDWDL